MKITPHSEYDTHNINSTNVHVNVNIKKMYVFVNNIPRSRSIRNL